MKIALVIVNFRSAAETAAALASAREHLSPELAVIVENGSGESDRLRAFGADVAELPVNRGFAAGVNAGIARVLALDPEVTAAMILNPDARLLPGDWRGWCGGLARGVAVQAPKILSLDGRAQASTYGPLAPSRTLLEAIGVHAFVSRLGFRRDSPSRRAEVHGAQGSCLLIAIDAWRTIGPFDERFFLYHEEVDWCARAIEAGLKVIFDPGVSVAHEKGTEVPSGREGHYYRGLVLLVRKRFGDAYAESYRRRLRAALGMSALMSRKSERFERLHRLSREL